MRVKLKTGYIVRRCRRCRAEKDNVRYHSDVAYQAKVRARSLERYREMHEIDQGIKEAQATGCPQSR